MTETEWLTSTDPQEMLQTLLHQTDCTLDMERTLWRCDNRKLRLFACTVCRQVWNLLANEHSQKAVEIAEQFADADQYLSHSGLLTARRQARAEDGWVWCATCPDIAVALRQTIYHNNVFSTVFGPTVLPATQANLLRDIIGNPFRPLTVNHVWLTWNDGTIPRLAEEAYQRRCTYPHRCKGLSHKTGCNCASGLGADSCPHCHGTGTLETGELDPARLAIIADALEEAGCGEDRILRHLRRRANCETCGNTGVGMDEYTGSVEVIGGCPRCGGDAGPHVRGCWAVDLLRVKV